MREAIDRSFEQHGLLTRTRGDGHRLRRSPRANICDTTVTGGRALASLRSGFCGRDLDVELGEQLLGALDVLTWPDEDYAVGAFVGSDAQMARTDGVAQPFRAITRERVAQADQLDLVVRV